MRINRVIRTLIMSDFFLTGGFSVFSPVLAVFVTRQIDGGTIATVGFATAIMQVVKIIFELPVAKLLDKDHGEYDDYFSLVFGTVIIALIPFLYFFASKIVHVYLIQALYGLGIAFTVPPWSAIFSRHVDKNQANMEYAVESVGLGIGSAAAAALGGVIAQQFGFRSVFIIGGVISMYSTIILIKIYSDMRAKVPRGQVKATPDKAPGI